MENDKCNKITERQSRLNVSRYSLVSPRGFGTSILASNKFTSAEPIPLHQPVARRPFRKNLVAPPLTDFFF
jgi:hypothetical protein